MAHPGARLSNNQFPAAGEPKTQTLLQKISFLVDYTVGHSYTHGCFVGYLNILEILLVLRCRLDVEVPLGDCVIGLTCKSTYLNIFEFSHLRIVSFYPTSV